MNPADPSRMRAPRTRAPFSRLRFREMILVLYVVSVALPIGVTSAVVVGIYRNLLADDYVRSVSEAIAQVARNVESRKESYERVLLRAATDREIQDRLVRVYRDMRQQWETVTYLDKAIGTLGIVDMGISRLRIYHDNPTLVEDGGVLWKPGARMRYGTTETQWYVEAVMSPERMWWRAQADPADRSATLSLVQQIVELSGTVVGLGVLDIDSASMLGNLTETAFQGAGSICLADGRGIVFVATDPMSVGEPLQEFLGARVRWPAADGVSAIARIDGNAVVVVREISSRWTVAGRVPIASVPAGNVVGLRWTLAVSVMSIVLTAALVLIVLNRLTRRLAILGQHMNAVAQGQFITLPRRGRDELGDIEAMFDSMSGRLSGVMEDFAAAKVQEREMAFNALQAHVNPHFLYNSLGVLRWMAMDAKSEELCRAIDSLALFYRLALKNDGGFVTIADEVAHARAYVDIQQIRFAHRVRVDWEVDGEIAQRYTVKLLLQTLIENCYSHAHVTGRRGGMILVAVRREREGIVIEVIDNGVGMTAERLAAVNAGAVVEPTEHGYGIRNLRDRLRLCFGERGSLAIESAEGAGTRVRVVIPECREAPRISPGRTHDSGDDRRG